MDWVEILQGVIKKHKGITNLGGDQIRDGREKMGHHNYMMTVQNACLVTELQAAKVSFSVASVTKSGSPGGFLK